MSLIFRKPSKFSKPINIMYAFNCVVLCLIMIESSEAVPNIEASEFNKFTIVRPVVYHARTRRQISTTRQTNGEHHPELTMTVPVDGEELILDLQINHGLITDNHVLKYYKDGKPVMHKPTKQDIDLCEYGGTVRHKRGSWVAVSTCHGVRGVVFDGEKTRHIKPSGADILAEHYMYEPALLRQNNTDYILSSNKHQNTREKRSVGDSTQFPEYFFANSDDVRYLELAIVVDNGWYTARDSDLHAVHQEIKSLVNILNSVYNQLNIVIALAGLEVWTEGDKIEIEESSVRTLEKFMSYRRQLSEWIPNDNAHLLTWKAMDVDGVAFVGSMCSENSVALSSCHCEDEHDTAVIMRHLMGHNFNMHHDYGYEEDCECPTSDPEKKCIMGGNSSPEQAEEFGVAPTCGNGLVEASEQCDCGAEPGAPCATCCDPGTCSLRADATCGAGACCDLVTCYHRPGKECRAARQQCDLPDHSSGDSRLCPDDVYKIDESIL